jgi:hypothetical protein
MMSFLDVPRTGIVVGDASAAITLAETVVASQRSGVSGVAPCHPLRETSGFDEDGGKDPRKHRADERRDLGELTMA